MKVDKYSENIILVSEKGKAEQEYWVNKLQGEVIVSSFPRDYIHSVLKDSRYKQVEYKLPDAVCLRVNQLSNKSKYAAYMVLLAGVKYLLYKYAGSSDVVVGMPAFKQKVEGEYSENVLALRTNIEGSDTFKSILGKIKNTVLEVDKNQNYPLFKTAELLGLQLEGDKYRFNTIVALEEIHSSQALNYVNADIKLLFNISEKSLNVKVEYDDRYFRESTVNQIIKHMINFFEVTAANMDMQLSQIEILSEEEKNVLLNEFNKTKAEYPKEKTINQMFEEQAEAAPDNIAVVFEDKNLTYRELNEKANQLAKVLRKNGVKTDNIVGIMIERSIDMIIGILGVLKSGGVYLPIDPQYPKDRIKYMLEDSKADILLTTGDLINSLEFDGTILNIAAPEIHAEAKENLVRTNNYNDMAYVIYTSGSTGKPKGVMLEHKGISNLREFFRKDFGINNADRIIQFASSSFDASVWEIFMALLNGAALYIVPKDVINSTEKFESFLNDNQITVVTLPPTYLSNLKAENINTLKRVITAGSAAGHELVKKWNHKVIYINAYGPTETTICTTTFVCDEAIDNYSSIPIGKPIYNTKVLIIDKNNKLTPIGVAGELCVAGDTLARGYLNRPELTTEKFTENPYKSQEKIYHTGDLARWLPDGNIEFLGRIDHQVKIRGYRIELGEIEAQLLKNEYVKDVLVMAKDDNNGDKYLCAYVVCNKDFNVQDLRQYLANAIPEYMIPAYFIKLDEMPLTPNGKIDRKALPEPNKGKYSSQEYAAPRNELEEIAASLWQEVLGVERVGIKDSFFELGGDSIKAIQVVSRLKKFGLKCEVKDMFTHKTIEGLSDVIVKVELVQIEQGTVKGEVDFTSIQQWFFDKQFINKEHWNQSVMLYGKNGFDADMVQKVFEKIIEHHDALRMVYRKVGQKLVQYNRDIKEGDTFTFTVLDLVNNEDYKQILEEEVDRTQRSINLEAGPLVKLVLFKTKEGDHLLIVIHHLVVDGVSWRIIFEDFNIGYNQLLNNKEIKFQDKTHSYKEWAAALKHYAESKELFKEADYWSKLEAVDVPILPVDIESEKKSKVKDINTLELSFTEAETERLLKDANKAYSTEINDILLTALGTAVKQWADIDKVLVSLEGHGREDVVKDIDINRTVGWFTSQYPVLLDMAESDISYLIRTTKEELKNIPNKGIGYGMLRYLSKVDKGFEFRHNPEICFNYLGQFGQDINTDLFSLSRFNTGQNVSPESENLFKLSINGMISSDKLVMAFSYSSKQYNEASIAKLMETYKNNLISIIEHCVSRDKAVLTPSDVGCRELSVKQFDKVYDVWGDNIKSIYRLSPTQEGMLFHAVLDTESHTYFQQITFDISGNIDAELLEKSFNLIIDRHDILRTKFIYKSYKKPLQVVLHKGQVKVHYEDATDIDENMRAAYIEDFKLKDRNKGFDLTKDTLIRLAVLKAGEAAYKFIWSFHHILMDGWCLGIINKELFEIYTALKNNVSVQLPKAHNYSSYIEWLEKQDEEVAKEYWTQYLGDYENRAAIPKTNAGQLGRFAREEYNFIIDKNITERISNIAKKNNTTTNIVLQSIWGILLQRYNNTKDVVFGAVMSGRRSEIEGVEEIVGLFINTVPVRVKCDINTPFTELLMNMQQAALLNEKYSYYPLVEIQEVSPLKGALIDHIMVFENYPIEKNLMESGNQNNIGFAIVDVEAFQQTNYDFGITMFPGEDIAVRLTYNSAVYDREFINNIEAHLKEAAAQIIEKPDTKAGDIGILSKEQQNKILFDFNNTKADYPQDRTINQLFEQQAQRTPDNIAVVFEDSHLTYNQLDEKANQLAGLLSEKGIREESIVGIMVYPSLEMIIGILGTLKAGAAYLPIDPEIPSERIKQIIEDSGIDVLLTQKAVIKENSVDGGFNFNVQPISLEDEAIYSKEPIKLNIEGKPEHTVYIIYTSGTTGMPKGVQLKHSCLANYVNWFSGWVGLTSKDKAVLVSSYAFDLGYTALYSSLLNGCELHLLKKERYSDPEVLANYIMHKGITYIKATPSLFNMLVNNKGFETSAAAMPLRLVVLGGEAINIEDIERFHKKYQDTLIVNHYGPTETTIGSIAYKVDFDSIEQYKETPVIGSPINNTEVYILDDSLEPVPVGVTGEIHIAGAGISKGYLNRPEITAEKFVPNPFSETYKVMYKTGDLGTFTKNGTVEFLGRKDHQVKIRGYRVELSEITSCLLKDENITDAIVIAKDDNNGGKYLCAYVVNKEGMESSTIRTNLAKQLPEYMIPSFFISLPKLPLTANGKIDGKALPEPYGVISAAVEYTAPRNEVEAIMADIWQEVLGVDKIGIDHNFFEMGGHSLKLINLIARVFEAFDVELSPKQLLEAPTVRQLAEGLANGAFKDQHPLMLLNSEKESRIFCFPPVGGYGLVYKNLADISKDYAYYSFNYIDDSGSNLHQYVRYIQEVQPQGPYTLMGWSAGGNLAFEVAKEMEKQGHEVADLILVDVHRMIKNMDMPKEEIQKMVNENLVLAQQDEFYKDYLNKNSFIRNKVASRMENYFTYLRNEMINSGYVNSDIHLIMSTDEMPEENDLRGDWHKVTRGKFTKYQGKGSHSYMLYTGFVEENAKLVREILNK